jgi:hypothetical protein
LNYSPFCCEKLHFREVIQSHTDRKLGDCSYLNACRHLQSCKFVHYEIDTDPSRVSPDAPAHLRREDERIRREEALAAAAAPPPPPVWNPAAALAASGGIVKRGFFDGMLAAYPEHS